MAHADHQSPHAPTSSDRTPCPTPPPVHAVIAAAKAMLSPAPPSPNTMMLCFTPRSVTVEMINAGFKGLDERFPPILTLEQAADLLGLKEQTIRKHLSEGKYPRSSRRGHPIRFLRDLLVHEYMSGGLS